MSTSARHDAPTATTGEVLARETVVDVDLFAGPGGHDVAAARLGLRPVGIEHDKAACQTRAAAGHLTIRADVSRFVLPRGVRLRGLIGSPPCQAWSDAGKGLGKLDAPAIYAHLARCEDGWVPYARDGWHDDRSPLVLEPVRFIAEYEPEWVLLEQVPPVLDFWIAVRDWMRRRGYSAWATILSAEEYGVPQTRARAILGASRTRTTVPPKPTHRAYRGEDHGLDLFGDELLPYVTMAGALGWGADARPTPTLTAGGTASGGPEPFARGGRAALAKEAGGGALA